MSIHCGICNASYIEERYSYKDIITFMPGCDCKEKFRQLKTELQEEKTTVSLALKLQEEVTDRLKELEKLIEEKNEKEKIKKER